ncbi:hypothetical protein G7Z17_g3003 [Cylindrodendrum hubeiense]|uniref:Zn(2)-C6 fungal-type domain-containing protein n=1 Tax=Cylindrodendrum hubeiense TaxID=595255 RepID=A0A9P5HGM8_9HYPO|nr:hypothetical protein G7Z17_g3003 [Cylindrodendrum hubeiense]
MSSGNAPTQGLKRPHVGGDGVGLRTAIACRACRERKTRCSGHQPTCAYCVKAGVPCEYAPNVLAYTPQNAAPTFDEWGEKILHAINSLASDLNNSHRHFENLSTVDANNDVSPTAAFSESRSETWAKAVEEQPSSIPIEGPTPITSLPSILAWDVFSRQDDVLARFSLLLSDHARLPNVSQTSGKESASCARSDLLALASIFEARVLPAMPIIDMVKLRSYISEISEFGVQWDTESCLVLLVAALASLSSHHEAQSSEMRAESSVLTPTTNLSIEFTINALRYWNMAKKRLAWALEDSGLVAAQCQFLAGIWHLYASKSTAAWKMFNGSVLAIDTVGPRHESRIATGQWTSDESLKENLRWACVGFLCRLRCEEEFAISPSNYKLPGREIESQDATLLHLRQSTLMEFRTLSADMSVKDLSTLHATIAAAEKALGDWYKRLPAPLRFSTNEEPETQFTESGPYRALLRSRYIETKELILRPSLYVLLHVGCLRRRAGASSSNTLQDVLHGYYRDQFQAMNIQHRALILTRLDSYLNPPMDQPFTDAGWFKTRTCLSLALLLLAAERGIYWDATNEGFSPHTDCTSVLDAVEDLLRIDCISGISSVYASLLHDLRAN